MSGTAPEAHHSMIIPYLGLPAGEETVGQLCCQLPQRDPESASIPRTPTEHHRQLEILEATVTPLTDCLSADLPPLFFWTLDCAGLIQEASATSLLCGAPLLAWPAPELCLSND
jgi:hypothetical protein